MQPGSIASKSTFARSYDELPLIFGMIREFLPGNHGMRNSRKPSPARVSPSSW